MGARVGPMVGGDGGEVGGEVGGGVGDGVGGGVGDGVGAGVGAGVGGGPDGAVGYEPIGGNSGGLVKRMRALFSFSATATSEEANRMANANATGASLMFR